ncbi:MAG: hypothetical protein DSY40_01365 [Nautilia sp.]|nr:MAG: hypothetical protein DSY40_01365 [Nautilia sp.]
MIENILEIRVGEEVYGFDADKIEQILEIPSITPVPLSDSSMLGVVVLSGKIYQVLDVGRVLNLESVNIKNEKARLLTISNKEESFVVDEVLGMISVNEENFEENSDKDSFLSGFYKTENEVVQILDIEKLLNSVSLDSFTPVKLDNLQNNEETQTENEEVKRVLFFKAGDEKFAINIESLRELIFVPEITPIAKSDALGMITLREEIITILDMNSLLGFSYKEVDEKSRALITYFDGKSVALLVDEVEEVRSIKNSDIENIPQNMANDMIEAIYKDEKSIASIISNDFLRHLTREYHLEEENITDENNKISENDMSEIAVFKIGNEEYAFDIEEVQEIIRYDEITPVPESPDFIEGILNLRGAVISIVNLPERLGFEKNITDKTKIIVCAVKNEKIGFIVDDVSEILFVEDEYISKSTNEEALFDEVINLDDGKRVILKIKVSNLIDDETFEKIEIMEK